MGQPAALQPRCRDIVTLVGELLHVQHSDLDALLGKQEHDALADAVGAARHDDNFLLPVPLVGLPVVDDLVVEPATDRV